MHAGSVPPGVRGKIVKIEILDQTYLKQETLTPGSAETGELWWRENYGKGHAFAKTNTNPND